MCNILGDGGVKAQGAYKMKAMQMLHGAYNIQNYHKIEELCGLWKFVRGECECMKFKKLEEPVLAR